MNSIAEKIKDTDSHEDLPNGRSFAPEIDGFRRKITRLDKDNDQSSDWIALSDDAYIGVIKRAILPHVDKKLGLGQENLTIDRVLINLEQFCDELGMKDFLLERYKTAIADLANDDIEKAMSIARLLAAYAIIRRPLWFQGRIEKERNREDLAYKFEGEKILVPKLQIAKITKGLLVGDDICHSTEIMKRIKRSRTKHTFVSKSLNEIAKIAKERGFDITDCPAGDFLGLLIDSEDAETLRSLLDMRTIELDLELDNPHDKELFDVMEEVAEAIRLSNAEDRTNYKPLCTSRDGNKAKLDVHFSIGMGRELSETNPLQVAFVQCKHKVLRMIGGEAYVNMVNAQKKAGKAQCLIPNSIKEKLESEGIQLHGIETPYGFRLDSIQNMPTNTRSKVSDPVNELEDLPWNDPAKVEKVLETFIVRGLLTHPARSYHGIASLDLDEKVKPEITNIAVVKFCNLEDLRRTDSPSFKHFLTKLSEIQDAFHGRVDIVELYDGKAYLTAKNDEDLYSASKAILEARTQTDQDGRRICISEDTKFGASIFMDADISRFRNGFINGGFSQMEGTALSLCTRIVEETKDGSIITFASQAAPERSLRRFQPEIDIPNLGRPHLTLLSDPEDGPVYPEDVKIPGDIKQKISEWKKLAGQSRQSSYISNNRLSITGAKGTGLSTYIAYLASYFNSSEDELGKIQSKIIRIPQRDNDKMAPYDGLRRIYRVIFKDFLPIELTKEIIQNAADKIFENLKQLANSNPPLVLCLDGLDHLDGASRELMEAIMNRSIGLPIIFVSAQNETLSDISEQRNINIPVLDDEEITRILINGTELESGQRPILVNAVSACMHPDNKLDRTYRTVNMLKNALVLVPVPGFDKKKLKMPNPSDADKIIKSNELDTIDAEILEYIAMLGSINIPALLQIAKIINGISNHIDGYESMRPEEQQITLKVYLIEKLQTYRALGILKHESGELARLKNDEDYEDIVFKFRDSNDQAAFRLRGSADEYDRRIGYLRAILEKFGNKWPLEYSDVLADPDTAKTIIEALIGIKNVQKTSGAVVVESRFKEDDIIYLACNIAKACKSRNESNEALKYFEMAIYEDESKTVINPRFKEDKSGVLLDFAAAYMDTLISYERFDVAERFAKVLGVDRLNGFSPKWYRSYLQILYMQAQSTRLGNLSNTQFSVLDELNPIFETFKIAQAKIEELESEDGGYSDISEESKELYNAMYLGAKVNKFRLILERKNEAEYAEANGLMDEVLKSAGDSLAIDFFAPNLALERLKNKLNDFMSSGLLESEKSLEARAVLIRCLAFALDAKARLSSLESRFNLDVDGNFVLGSEICMDALDQAYEDFELEGKINPNETSLNLQARENIFRENVYLQGDYKFPGRLGRSRVEEALHAIEKIIERDEKLPPKEARLSSIMAINARGASRYDENSFPGNPAFSPILTPEKKDESLDDLEKSAKLCFTKLDIYSTYSMMAIYNIIELCIKDPVSEDNLLKAIHYSKIATYLYKNLAFKDLVARLYEGHFLGEKGILAQLQTSLEGKER